MKNKANSILMFPRTFVVCFGSVLACASASAAPFVYNEHSNSNPWVLPAGTNLLATATPTPLTSTTIYGASNSWGTLTNGSVGSATPGGSIPYTSQMNTVVMPNNGAVVTFALDLSGAHSVGYDITAFDSYGLWNDPGRDDQTYTIAYSTVATPAVFTTLTSVNNHTANPGDGAKSTHTRISDTSGYLALHVAAIQITFGAQENGNAGYSEFVLTDTPPATLVTTLNEANTTNVWTLPAGTNLLHSPSLSSAAPTSYHASGNTTTSSSWTTLTDGLLGPASGGALSCVAPDNEQNVIFPLDLSVNIKGYDLSELDFYGAWQDSGRDNLDLLVRYSTWDNPTVFLPLVPVVNHDLGTQVATHTRLTPVSGNLVSGVAALQFYFNNQENSFVGYREFIALGQAAPLTTPIAWTGNSGSAGNASWITTADSNWTPGNFDPTSPLNFTDSGANRNITVPTALSASSLKFTNSTAAAYAFSGGKITVNNGITSTTGNGAATFNGPVKATTGVTQSGPGSLTFNGDLESPGLVLSGVGTISLNADNVDSAVSLFTGTASVNNGTLNIGDDLALNAASLAMTAGTANFTTAAPFLAGLTGTAGTVNLSNTALTIGTGSIKSQAMVFGGNIAQATGSGRLIKDGDSTLTLSGLNTYTGTTHVLVGPSGSAGTLQFAKEQSLYGGATTSWTSFNLLVDAGATLGFNVGGTGEFTDNDLNTVGLGGFAGGASLGINTTANFTLTRSISGPLNLFKSGTSALTLTGTNSFSGATTMTQGTINAANSSGVSLSGDVYLGDDIAGDGASSVFLNMAADNQFGPTSVLHLTNLTSNGANSKVNLRGTHQTIAGLDSPTNTFVSIIQNDDATVPDYVAIPSLGGATLTINTPVDTSYSFYGLIRQEIGGAVSIVKSGLGTQEFKNSQVQGFSYNGATTINAGTLKLNFVSNQSSWNSNVSIASGAFFELAGAWNFFRTVSGQGQLVKTGTGMISLCNVDGILNANSYTGGTVIKEGILKFYSNGLSTGEGNAAGQFCVAGPMDPTNVITVLSGATMGVGSIAPLGNSFVMPQFAPTIMIEPGGKLWGGEGVNLAFLANINLDGATVDVTTGSTAGGFNTNMTFVGTVVVGGVSTTPTVISTSGTGAYANISLGSLGLLGTTFQVADVTADSNVDLTVNSILQNVGGNPSPLTKTGAGTMLLTAANTYTGTTTVTAGMLGVSGTSIVDTHKLVIDGGKVDVAIGANEVVGTLYFGSTQQLAGTYGSTSSSAAHQDDTRFSGTGILTVTTNPYVDPYIAWSSVIANEADRVPTADPDGDGFSNLQEYLFGTSPIANTGALTTFESTPSGLIVRWSERANTTYILQESSTLADPWTTSAAVITDAADQSSVYSAEYVLKQATIAIDGSRKFVRVQASGNP